MKILLDQVAARVRVPRLPRSSSRTTCYCVTRRCYTTPPQVLRPVPHKLLSVQSSLLSSISPFLSSGNTTSTRSIMSSTNTPISTQHQQDISNILDYWFTPFAANEHVSQKWFRPAGPEATQIDNHIRGTFGPLVEAARSDSLDTWSSTPRGAVALIILLDQFPRNIYRGSGASFSSDAKAVEVAVQALARESDRSPQITDLQSMFFYLPLMHSENLLNQVACIATYEHLVTRCLKSERLGTQEEREDVANVARRSLTFAKSHREVILRFGRFPSRNVALGRESTEEEVRFLEENPSGFA